MPNDTKLEQTKPARETRFQDQSTTVPTENSIQRVVRQNFVRAESRSRYNVTSLCITC